MDGKDLSRRLRQLLLEASDSDYLDSRTSFDYIWEAAKEFARVTKCITAEQSITTVAEQAAYSLNGDYIGLYLKDKSNRFYVKYNDGTNDHFITFRDYEDVIFSNQTTSQSVPDRWTIKDKQDAFTQITGTATSAGAATGGKSVLTDSAADFTNVWPGDVVHNTTDASDGVVSGKTSTTAISTCLFGGTDNDWTSSDAYIIQPLGRFQIVLDPLPSTAGHTLTFYYVQLPPPVYSDYDAYRFPWDCREALIKYAAWLYKYRDDEPNFGDMLYMFWQRALAAGAQGVNTTRNRQKFRVNFKKRR